MIQIEQLQNFPIASVVCSAREIVNTILPSSVGECYKNLTNQTYLYKVERIIIRANRITVESAGPFQSYAQFELDSNGTVYSFKANTVAQVNGGTVEYANGTITIYPELSCSQWLRDCITDWTKNNNLQLTIVVKHRS